MKRKGKKFVNKVLKPGMFQTVKTGMAAGQEEAKAKKIARSQYLAGKGQSHTANIEYK